MPSKHQREEMAILLMRKEHRKGKLRVRKQSRGNESREQITNVGKADFPYEITENYAEMCFRRF